MHCLFRAGLDVGYGVVVIGGSILHCWVRMWLGRGSMYSDSRGKTYRKTLESSGSEGVEQRRRA